MVRHISIGPVQLGTDRPHYSWGRAVANCIVPIEICLTTRHIAIGPVQLVTTRPHHEAYFNWSGSIGHNPAPLLMGPGCDELNRTSCNMPHGDAYFNLSDCIGHNPAPVLMGPGCDQLNRTN